MKEKNLSKKDIEEIKFLAMQGPNKINRVRLICSLYKIDRETLYMLLNYEN